MYFADLDVDMLLGLDFLEKHKAVLDLARHEVHLGDQVIQARIVVDGATINSVARVKLADRTRIPPQFSVFSLARLDCPINTEFLFQPIRDATPCMVPASFHQNGDLSMIQMINDTDQALIAEPGTIVGLAFPAEECGGETAGRSPAATVRKVGPQSAKTELPTHLVDLFERSAKGLKKDERRAIKHLLIEYADVFAAHDLELGCFKTLRHPINLFECKEPFRESTHGVRG